ncbi:CHAT domain-containing protein [Lasiosphaeris hirsuta]|uniref:CHAT domain-containing protein n=1 Tax=Lasiosphaeris hirsuta TaxID=260670 RepID=A0AA40E815_9PEZI|nr:CHAT domain-containing protein [Lasiosphaeris hirsuta]
MNYFYYKILTIAIYEGLLDTEVFKPLVQTRLQAILQILQETGQSHDIVLFSLFLADQSTSEHDKENILRPLLENPTLLPVDRAHVALELGVAAATSGDASKAAPLFQSAEELFEQSSCRDGILKSRLQRLDMTSPMTASTFEEMLQLANAFEKLNSVASEFSTLFHAMTAAAELASWNNFTSAFDRARIVSSRTKNGYFLLKIHLTFAANMVTWPQHLGKSVATLREFLDPASTQTPRTSGQASLLLGQVCTLLGDKENGLKYAKRAVKEFEKGCDYELISDAKLALALAMDSGETGGQLAVKLLTDSLTLDKQHNYLKGQIAKYDALVWLESRLAQHGGSSEGFHNARQMLWMVKREALKSRETPNALLRRAKICVATKEFNDAEKLAKEALAELSSRDNVREVAQCQNIIFQSYFRNPTPAAGDSAILDQARLTFEAYRNLGLENIPVEFIMEISMAFEEIGQRHPEDKIHLHSEALGYLKVGQSVCERNRADLSDSSGLASLRQKQLLVASVFQSDIRTRALRLSLGLGDGEKLWEWTQTAKARALADTVAPRLISAAALSPELIGDTEAVEILEEEERLLEELQGAHAGESIELRIKLDRLHARMDGHSSLSHLLASRDGVRGLEDLDWIFKGDAARRLPENKKIVLVDWVFVGEAIVMITLDSSLKPQLSSLDITVSQIRQWKRKHLSIVETTQSRDQLLLLDRARLDEISGLVSELGRLSSEGDLLVLCPTLVLHAIPLHALTYDGSHILIARNPVVYSTSLSLLRQCCRRADARKRGNSLRAAVFAVYEDKASERENKASERENKASEREKIYSCMRKLACDFKTEPLLGPYATRHNLESLVRGVDILHYHGHMDEHVNVLHQSLRLSRGHKEPAGSGADDGGGDDDAFTVRDAFALRIDAALACMVACSSGVQAFTPGDEPQGMLAALQVAGCASAVGTLWPVDSRDGRDFAGYFYRALHKQHGAGGPVNVAICFQKAVLRLLNRREAGYKGEEIRVPYHWAAFVLHGAWYL